jgi:hypothetical protein
MNAESATAIINRYAVGRGRSLSMDRRHDA